jgi:hypothetical protein
MGFNSVLKGLNYIHTVSENIGHRFVCCSEREM